MELVVDANIFIAAVISQSGRTAELFFSDDLILSAPDFLTTELWKYKEEILKKTGFSESEFKSIIVALSSKIRLYSAKEFLPFLDHAKTISPDMGDVPYFAVALKLGCALWSNDKRLKSQNEVRVFSTTELLQ